MSEEIRERVKKDFNVKLKKRVYKYERIYFPLDVPYNCIYQTINEFPEDFRLKDVREEGGNTIVEFNVIRDFIRIGNKKIYFPLDVSYSCIDKTINAFPREFQLYDVRRDDDNTIVEFSISRNYGRLVRHPVKCSINYDVLLEILLGMKPYKPKLMEHGCYIERKCSNFHCQMIFDSENKQYSCRACHAASCYRCAEFGVENNKCQCHCYFDRTYGDASSLISDKIRAGAESGETWEEWRQGEIQKARKGVLVNQIKK
jgi:hypothetical protein